MNPPSTNQINRAFKRAHEVLETGRMFAVAVADLAQTIAELRDGERQEELEFTDKNGKPSGVAYVSREH